MNLENLNSQQRFRQELLASLDKQANFNNYNQQPLNIQLRNQMKTVEEEKSKGDLRKYLNY